jgi:hypothetical protein
MSLTRISINFSSNKYTDTELNVKANHIIEKMTGNAAFPTPEPTLEAVQEASDAYLDALDNVQDGSREDTVRKNHLRTTLEGLLRQLADYVWRVSQGDEILMLSSGFDLYKKPETVGPLSKPTNLVIKPGSNKGSMELSCNAVRHATFYEFEYREVASENGNGWIKCTSTKRKLLVQGLTSGKAYVFRVAGAGSDPSRTWSDEIASFVL